MSIVWKAFVRGDNAAPEQAQKIKECITADSSQRTSNGPVTDAELKSHCFCTLCDSENKITVCKIAQRSGLGALHGHLQSTHKD